MQASWAQFNQRTPSTNVGVEAHAESGGGHFRKTFSLHDRQVLGVSFCNEIDFDDNRGCHQGVGHGVHGFRVRRDRANR